MFKNESNSSKIQKSRVKYESMHSKFLNIYISTRSIIIKNQSFIISQKKSSFPFILLYASIES